MSLTMIIFNCFLVFFSFFCVCVCVCIRFNVLHDSISSLFVWFSISRSLQLQPLAHKQTYFYCWLGDGTASGCISVASKIYEIYFGWIAFGCTAFVESVARMTTTTPTIHRIHFACVLEVESESVERYTPTTATSVHPYTVVTMNYAF